MADDGVDHILVDVQLMQHFVCLDAVLLGVEFKVDVVEHSDGRPEIHAFGVKFLGKLAHDLGNGLGVLDMEGVLVVAHNKLLGLLNSGDVAHIFTSSEYDAPFYYQNISKSTGNILFSRLKKCDIIAEGADEHGRKV